MKTKKTFSTLLLLLISFSAYSQNGNWTIEKTDDKVTTVKYKTIEVEEGTHVYYGAERNIDTPIAELDAYFSNIENHKNFLVDYPITKELKKISDNEWIAYYYLDPAWPFPNADIVIRIVRSVEADKIIFTLKAAPNEYKKTDVERITTYNNIYTFQKIDDKTTKISFHANYIPKGFVPVFLLNLWFPEGPAEIITNLGLKK